MKNLIISLLIILVLVGCGPSPEAIKQALEKTFTAQPTPTFTPAPTQIPLSEIDLDAIIILPNDLPAGYSSGQAHEVTREQFHWVSNKGPNNLYQQIARDNEQAGGVTVFIYENTSDAQKAYQELVDALGDDFEKLEDVGDEAAYVILEMEVAGVAIEHVTIAFRRCNASVDILFSDTTELMEVSAYAKRLDERLQPLICR